MGGHVVARLSQPREAPAIHRFHSLGKRSSWSRNDHRDAHAEGALHDGHREYPAPRDRRGALVATTEAISPIRR